MRASLDTIQEGIREELRREVGRSRFRLWFRDTELAALDADAVTLAVPTEVHRTWLQYTYGDLLRNAVETVLGAGVAVRLEVSSLQGARREVRERLPSRPQDWEALLERRRPVATLDGFVTEDAHRFPVLLLQQFVHGNGVIDPPSVYLYGPEGTGKSHLLSGLRDAVESYGPGQCLYVTSRRFTSMFVSALRAKDMEAVRAFEVDFRHRRLVLIDDVHLLSGRRATQQALVNLRERAVGTQTRFVFASRRHPRELEHVSAKLRSWFMGAVVLRLPAPGREGLDRILATRGRRYGLPEVPAEIRRWTLERTGSVRGAVDVLDRWAAASAELGTLLGAEWLEEIAPAVSVTAREEIVRRAKQAVSHHFGIAPSLLERATKARRAAVPRRVAMYLVYRATALPLAEIGKSFGLKSHSSVSRAIQEMRDERQRDPALEQTIDGLLARM